MDMSELLIKMVIFVVLILVGYTGARKGMLSPDFARSTSRLVMTVFMPASVLNSVSGPRPDLSGGELWGVMGLVFFVIFFSYLVSAIMVRFLRQKPGDAAVTELLMAVPNTMFVGLPVLQSVYGPEAVLYLALSNIPFNLALYSYGIWRLRSSVGEAKKFSFDVKQLLSIPMIATLLALIVFVLDIPLPRLITSMTGTISAGTTPLSMIVIGATLGPTRLLDAFLEKRMLFASAVRLLLCPLLTLGILSLFISDIVLLTTCVVIAGCPSGVLVSVLALQNKCDAVLASKGVLSSTLLSMATMPLLVWLLTL